MQPTSAWLARLLGATFVLAAAAAAQTIGTTVLTFDVAGGGAILPQDYGDSVAAPTQGAYSYGGTAPFTPDVSVQYLPPAGADFYLWGIGYGDLSNAIWSSAGSPTASITLAAANGAGVHLIGFDLAGWNGSGAISVPAINVKDGVGATLYTAANVLVPGAPGAHLHVGFSPPLAGLTIVIELVLPPSGMNFLAIDNVAFGEFSASGIGQANRPQAAMRINGIGSAGLKGPFAPQIAIGGTLALSWDGPPGAPLFLVSAPPNPANLGIPCTGIVDIGTPPFYADLFVIFDGTQATLPDSLFRLTAAGTAQQAFTLPGPMTVSLQGAVFQPAGSPCPIVLTAAFTVTVL